MAYQIVFCETKVTHRVDGEALRALRLRRGISLRSLARKLGCSPTYLSRVEIKGGRVSGRFASIVDLWVAGVKQ